MRSDALTDALTPPAEAQAQGEAAGAKGSGGVEGAIPNSGSQLDLDNDMLVGDEEEVYTTPARLLAAVELAIKEARNAGDAAAVTDELTGLRADVAARCDFL